MFEYPRAATLIDLGLSADAWLAIMLLIVAVGAVLLAAVWRR